VRKRTRVTQSVVLIAIIVAICAAATAVNPRFLRVQNILNIFQQIAILGIVACGVGMLLVAGQIDISVGNQITFLSIVLALALQKMLGEPGTLVPAWHTALAIPLAASLVIVLGFLMGLLNGIVVVKSRASSFVITLGFMTVYNGAALVTGSGTGYPMSGRFEWIGRGRLLDTVPIPVLFFLGVVMITFLVLKYFRYGRFLYAIGDNRKAAYVSGINTGRVTIIAFVVTGLCNALAALILASRVGFTQANIASSFSLDALAAVIVGGVGLSGGKGSALNIFLGVLLIGLISNALIIIRVNPYARDVVMGLIIIVSVTIGQYTRDRE
jgi:ribose transport system permease protein